MDENEHIDAHLRASLIGFRVQPRGSSFDDVLYKIRKKKRRRLLFWLLPAGAGCLTGLILLMNSSIFHPPAAGYSQQAGRPKEQDSRNVSAPSLLPAEQTNGPLLSGNPEDPETQRKAPASRANSPVAGSSLAKSSVPQRGESPNAPTPSGSEINPSLSPEAVLLNPRPAASLAAGQPTEDRDDTPHREKTGAQEPLHTDILMPVTMQLPVPERLAEPRMSLTEISGPFRPDTASPSAPARRIRVLGGLNFNPQLSSYHLSAAPQRNQVYEENTGTPFSERYLSDKRAHNRFSYNYSGGLKLGLVLDEKWEFMVGFGYQQYKEPVQMRRLVDSSTVTNFLPLAPNYDNTSLGSGKKGALRNTFRHLYYSAEAATYFTWNRFTRIKAGLGLQVNQVIRSDYYAVLAPNHYDYRIGHHAAPLSRLNYALNIRAGVIHDLSKRLQLQLSPSLFYTLNSMYRRDYIHAQRPYGLSLECLLLFRLSP